MQPVSLKESVEMMAQVAHAWAGSAPVQHVRGWLLSLLIGKPVPMPELAPPNPEKDPTLRNRVAESLARSCLAWRDTGRWPAEEPAIDFEGETERLVRDLHEMDQDALLALAALRDDGEALARLRARMRAIRIPIYRHRDELDQVWFLTGTNVVELLERHPEARWGWIARICFDTTLQRDTAPLIALAIRYCEEKRLSLGDWLRQGARELDANFCGADGKPRLECEIPDDVTLAVLRKPHPGIEIRYAVKGGGGRLVASLPVVLEFPIFSGTQFLGSILAGEQPLRMLLRARSKNEVRALLGQPDSVVRINVALAGDLAIEDRDLDLYRLQFEAAMDRVRGCFPDVKARTEIVVT